MKDRRSYSTNPIPGAMNDEHSSTVALSVVSPAPNSLREKRRSRETERKRAPTCLIHLS